MFLGTHTPRLDDKGRLFLPAKYREELSAGLVITKGQERCLYVFPETEFARITEALRTAPVTAKAVRDYSRVFFASASDEIPDKQGRITIPPGLRDYAGLQRDCVVIGANTRLEIWDAAPGRPTWPSRKRPSPTRPRRCCPGFSEGAAPAPGARRGLHPRWVARPADALPRRQADPVHSAFARMGTWPGTLASSGHRPGGGRWLNGRRGFHGRRGLRARAGHDRPGAGPARAPP